MAAPAAAQEPTAPAPAATQSPHDTHGRLTLRFSAGLGGTFESTARSMARDGSESVSEPARELLEPALGGHVQFEVPVLAPYLSLGFLVGGVSWATDVTERLDLGRSTWLDLDLTVRGQVELVDGLIELYVLVPFGLSVNRFDEKLLEVADVPWGHGPGFNVGALAGVAFDLGGHGLFVESGWWHRQFFHDAAGTTFGTPVTFELDGSTHQVHLGAGLFFDL